MSNPINISRAPEEAMARRLRQIEEDNGYPVKLRIAGAGGGAEGAPGKDGATWYSGEGAPAGGLGANNDFYLRTSNEDVYKKVAGVWGIITNIKGEKGAAGAEGPEGPAGVSTMSGFKEPCRVATTGNVTISTALNEGDSIDGVSLVNGNRVLVMNQTTKSQNGIYVVSASPGRATDADAAGELVAGTQVMVTEGSVHADRAFKLTTNGTITPGSTEQVWAPVVPKFSYGTTSTSFPTSPNATPKEVEHLLGTTPIAVVVSIYESAGTSTVVCNAGNLTSTKFTVYGRYIPGTNITNTIEIAYIVVF